VISGALKPYDNKLSRTADGLAVALAASLPWSTSATSILAGLWLVAILPTLNLAPVRRVLPLAPAALCLALVALAALGLLWSEAEWRPAFQALGQFAKLLVIPLLFIHFQKSERGLWVFGAFLISCALLLVVSVIFVIWPRPFGLRASGGFGVPVKDRIVQSGEFVLCAFGALYFGFDCFRAGRRWAAIGLAALSVAFVGHVAYITTSRTTLVVIPVLLIFFGLRQFGAKGTLALAAIGAVLTALLWMSSPHLRKRVVGLVDEVHAYQSGKATSAGQRLHYWTNSIEFIKEAPVAGHGTGTIRQLFEKVSGGISEWQTANPHNQSLAVGIQLGIVGILALWALWLSHFLLFRTEAGLAAWVGEIVVVQNVVSSLFNSHLFDFTQGWIYVFGVGVAGAMILRRRAAARSGANT